MISADVVIENTTSALKATSEALVTLVNQNVAGLLTEIGGVVCSEVYESDMKAVLNTILLAHAAGGILTAQQSTQMADIAAKCRYSGGYAVVLARGFFEPQDSYPQDLTCTTGERRYASKALLSDVVNLYPNPANELLTLQIGLLFERGTAQVFNTQGVLLNTFDIQGQSTVLPIAGLQNGSYFIEIRLDGRPSIHKAFVKIH